MKKHLLSLAIITILFACKKEAVLNNNVNATLDFSNDTITFDTVFASIGSITKTLTVYNRNNYDVKSNIGIASKDYSKTTLFSDLSHSYNLGTPRPNNSSP